MPWMNRGIALGAPTAESEMLRFSHCGSNRNGHVHFVFLTGSIQKAPVGSCSLRGGTKPPSSAQDLSRVGWHCKGQRRAATTTPLPPQHLWVPPKTQPSCPTAAGEVSSPAFSPPGTQNDHLIPRLRLGFCKEAGGEGGGRTFSPDLQDSLKAAERNLLGLQGWKWQEAAERKRSNVGILHPPPEGWGRWWHKPPGRKEVPTVNYHCIISG